MGILDIIVIVYFFIVFAAMMLRGKVVLSWPLWIQAAIFLPLVAGMFLMIRGMHKAETEREDTFMEVCWSAGVAHYPEDQEAKDACPGGTQQLLWPRKSMKVYWGMGPDFDEYRRSHEEAMRFWNKALGWEQFDEVYDPKMADITIVHGSASSHGAMSTSHSKKDGVITATIIVKKPGNIREWMLQEQHELGHCLGLAHDRSGIMKRDLSEGEQMKVWRLHDKDRDAIRSLYE